MLTHINLNHTLLTSDNPCFIILILMRFFFLLLIFCVLPSPLLAVDFSFYQQQGQNPGATLLVVGGVDGDEPGGFHAAATLVTHYHIEKGNLWIVPNLNFAAILKRQRGDMNLKFASISKQDPQYKTVKKIQEIITRPQVDLVLNLHDGSGFYHPKRVSSQRNPSRWGQSCVIDQQQLPGARFGQLKKLAEKTIQQLNGKVQAKEHYFQLKNVDTASVKKDIPAKKSLSYFAVSHNKPAVAIEASKNHPVYLRTYYHLVALESFMQQLGIAFSRDFPLTPAGVEQIIKDDALISLAGGRIQLELNNMRPELKNLPLAKQDRPAFSATNPLISMQPEGKQYRIHYGNNRLAFLNPQYFELDRSISTVTMAIDGFVQEIPFGTIIPVAKTFKVNPPKGYRTNVVGFANAVDSDDGHQQITYQQMNSRFSIDKAGMLFRVEVYRNHRFSGMVLVDFRPQSAKKEPLVAQTAPVDLNKTEQPN